MKGKVNMFEYDCWELRAMQAKYTVTSKLFLT